MSSSDDPGDFESVFAYVRTIPPGRVASYGDVGAAVGVTARTVGWALGACPDDVPWQRVVGADGYLRIARRSPHLRDLQKSLLEGEGVTVKDGFFVERRFFLGADDEPGDGTNEQPSLF